MRMLPDLVSTIHHLLFTVSRGLLAIGLIVLIACGGQAETGSVAEETPENRSDESTVVVSYPVDMQGVNELITTLTAAQTAVIYFSVFMPLLEEMPDYASGPPTFGPRLAESYEFSEDRLQLTFKIRPGMLWSDGAPITAEDVRWTWEAQTSEEIGWPYRESKRRIRDVEVIDDLTVRFHFSEVYATQLLDVNQGVILPKHAWSQLPFSEWRSQPEWFRENLVSSGPFLLEDWEKGQRFVLRRNERYFDEDHPKVDRIVFLITPDPSTQIAQLRSNQVHLAEWIRPGSASIIHEHPDLEIVSYNTRQFVFLSWNTRRPFFAEPAVRRALTMAIDRQTIIDTLYHGYATLSASPYISDSWVVNKDIDSWPHDPARAREILAEEGWADSDGDGILERDGKPFAFEMLTNADNDLRRDILVMIQEQLKQVGIDAQPRTMEFNTLTSREMAHDYDVSLVSVAIDTSLNLSYFLHTKSYDDGYNWGGYSNPEVDELLETLQTQSDFLSAKPLYDRLQVLFHEDQPFTILYEPMRLIGKRKNLKDVDPNNISTFFNMRRWRLEAD